MKRWGRTQAKLASLLKARGFDVEFFDIGPRRRPFWAEDPSWSAFGSKDGQRICIESDSTMGDCVRYGFVLQPQSEARRPYLWDAFASPAPKETSKDE